MVLIAGLATESGRKRPPVPEVRSPTVRRRELGVLLRALRTERGLTVEQVAEQLLCSASKVSRMETGQRGVTQRDVRDLCEIYGVTDQAQRDHIAMLATQGKQQGWWQDFDLVNYFGNYVGLEEEATRVRYYQSAAVPGLLQTPDYARAMHEIAVPKLTSERIDQLMEVRLKRQRRLVGDPPLDLWAILDEAVLHRSVGGAAVMKDQLERLTQAAVPQHVTIQVIPFSAGAHPAMESTFNILDFRTARSVVYVEGLLGFKYVTKPQEISRYQTVFKHLEDKALSPQESFELISKMAGDMR